MLKCNLTGPSIVLNLQLLQRPATILGSSLLESSAGATDMIKGASASDQGSNMTGEYHKN